jgi:hypothetical protein
LHNLVGTAALRLERQPLESLTLLNSTEATERGASLSVFSALSGISGSTPPAWPSSMRGYSGGVGGGLWEGEDLQMYNVIIGNKWRAMWLPKRGTLE